MSKAPLCKTVTTIQRTIKVGVAVDPVKRTPAKPPVVETVPANQFFTPKDESEYEELIGLGALRNLTDEENEALEADESAKAKAKTPAKKSIAKKFTPAAKKATQTQFPTGSEDPATGGSEGGEGDGADDAGDGDSGDNSDLV